MAESEINTDPSLQIPPLPAIPGAPPTLVSRLNAACQELLAVMFWTYVTLKLFVFDLDVYLLSKFGPDVAWVLRYKFFILIAFVSVWWLFTRTSAFVLTMLFFLFYPAIIVFWRIPVILFRNRSWNAALAFLSAVISSYKSMKYNFIMMSIFMVSVAMAIACSAGVLLISAAIALVVVVFLSYTRRLLLVFRRSDFHRIYMRVFSGARRHGAKFFAIDDTIKNLPVKSYDEQQMQKWSGSLQASVLFNRVCLFSARKLRDYQRSGIHFGAYILMILFLMFQTVVAFAAINYALFKTNGNWFRCNGVPGFFQFFYYSFNNLIFNSIPEIYPSSPLAQTAFMMETSCVLFLVAILVSLFFSFRGQRLEKELDEVIAHVEREGRDMEHFIQAEYKFNSIEDAIAELNRLKAGMLVFIVKISENLR